MRWRCNAASHKSPATLWESKGGLLGKQLEAVVVDPASDWPLFAEKARELIEVDDIAAVFGCWTSVSRKSVLPVFEELNSILFYPVQYEGEESQRDVFYSSPPPLAGEGQGGPWLPPSKAQSPLPPHWLTSVL